MVKRLPTMWETRVRSLGWEDPLEKEMATHSSILAWKIPWTEEPGRLQSMGLKRVRHDWATSLSLFILHLILSLSLYLYRWLSGKESACQCSCRRCGFDSWIGNIPWRRKWQPTPVFLPGKFHGQRSLAGYSPRGQKELHMMEHMCTHTQTHTYLYIYTHTYLHLYIYTLYVCMYIYIFIKHLLCTKHRGRHTDGFLPSRNV